jgi:steroid 5-alpha reductase family enzyme
MSLNLQVLILYLIQGGCVILLTLPFLFLSHVSEPGFFAIEMVGLLLWMWGLVGESVADWQLAQFRLNHPEKEAVCDLGLWHCSRHPNYFFEWLVWVAYALMALTSPIGVIAIVSPLLLLYLFLYVSGIPITEALALEKRGDEYRRYQESTPSFFPCLIKCWRRCWDKH